MNVAEKNIVLIGMRGSGKTTVGAILAGRLHRELIPMDALIVYELGMTIPEVVERHGWPRFREAKARGCRTVPGCEMLLLQGVTQFELWTGKPAPVDLMRSILLERLGTK